MERERFAAHLSLSSLIVTLLVFLIFGVGAIGSFAVADMRSGLIAVAVFVGLVIVGLFSVIAYEIDGKVLIVRHPLWSTKISLEHLTTATPTPTLAQGLSISWWSTRGIFGMLGYVHKSELGTYRAFITNFRNAVVLRFASGMPVVVSPDSPAQFVQRLSVPLQLSASPIGHGEDLDD